MVVPSAMADAAGAGTYAGLAALAASNGTPPADEPK
jgi:hypothetical protein